MRAPVGDKYVMEEMVKRGLALGGEQSGHIILADHLFTGDGMATALTCCGSWPTPAASSTSWPRHW